MVTVSTAIIPAYQIQSRTLIVSDADSLLMAYYTKTIDYQRTEKMAHLLLRTGVCRSDRSANPFNSPKFKKHITMMNTLKIPLHHLYKYAFILPILFISCFFVYPFQVRASGVQRIAAGDTTLSPKQLKAFEGVYTFQFKKGEDAFIKISAEKTGLVLKQMWDGKEIHFTAKSALEFQNEDGQFPLKFFKDKKGVIHQVLAFNRDLWTRTVKNAKQ